MNAALRRIGVQVLTAALRKLDAERGPSAPRPTDITGGHFDALVTFLHCLPVDDLIEVATGHATWGTAFDAAEHAADRVRVAFPLAAATATEIKMGLEALRFVLNVAGVGPEPFKIEGGVPAAFPPGGGPGPYRGR